MLSVSLAVLAAGAPTFVHASAVELAPVEQLPVLYFQGDASFAAYGLPGSGTATDPYRIEDRTILQGPALLGLNGMGALSIRDTRAHVVIQDVAFVPVQSIAAPVVAIDIRNAENITIQRVAFTGSNGYQPSILASNVRNVNVLDNALSQPSSFSFAAAHGLVVARNTGPLTIGASGSWITITDNDIDRIGVGGSGTVARNRANTLYASAPAQSTLDVRNNTVGAAEFRSKGIVARDNAITNEGGSLWVSPEAPADLDTSNTLAGRPVHLLVDAHDVTIDAAVTPVGWLAGVRVSNVTIRHLDLDERTSFWGAEELRIEDSRLGEFYVWARDPTYAWLSGNVSFVRSSAAQPFFSIASGSIEIQDSSLVGGAMLEIYPAYNRTTTASIRGSHFPGASTALYVGGGPVDARGNWWNSTDGPTVEGVQVGGQAIEVWGGASVRYDPWLLAPPS